MTWKSLDIMHCFVKRVHRICMSHIVKFSPKYACIYECPKIFMVDQYIKVNAHLKKKTAINVYKQEVGGIIQYPKTELLHN